MNLSGQGGDAIQSLLRKGHTWSSGSFKPLQDHVLAAIHNDHCCKERLHNGHV
jgi:hypothetical protein